MTPVKISIAATIASLLLLLVVLELIRGRRLKERYALLWIADRSRASRPLRLARRPDDRRGLVRRRHLSARDPLRGRDLFIIAVLLHYSTVLSALSDNNTLLAQRIALLEQRVGSREQGTDRDDAPPVT